MAALMLAHGDLAAKNMLKGLIDKRYGSRPPTLDGAIFDFQGRTFIQSGTSMVPIPLDATAMLRFPDAMRWDLMLRTSAAKNYSSTESFDGSLIYSKQGHAPQRIVTQTELIHSFIRRFLTLSAVFLTPLADTHIRLKTLDSWSFAVIDTRYNDYTVVHFNRYFEVTQIDTQCVHPDTLIKQAYTIIPDAEMIDVEGVIMPKKLMAYWDQTPYFELSPVGAETRIEIPTSIFRMVEQSDATGTVLA